MSVRHRVSRFLSILFTLGPIAGAAGQIPDQCFEIENILVDACNPLDICPGSTEGRNEMVRIRIGPDPISIYDLTVTWPNNAFQGFVQNTTTAALTAELNATVESCGEILEPPGGVMPSGAEVIIVTSTGMCVGGNSFAPLDGTVYIVYQAPGNTSGHFANHNNTFDEITDVPTGVESLRTLIITHIPTACADTVTYDRSLLVNTLGTYGGGTALNDGAAVEFSWPGDPIATYVNYGCLAPFVPVLPFIQVEGSLCDGGIPLLQGASPAPPTSISWSGGTGSFSDPESLATTYTAGPGDVGEVLLELCLQGPCPTPVCTTLVLPIGVTPEVSIAPAGDTLSLCAGDSLLLTASGADAFQWNNGWTEAGQFVSETGVFTVVGSSPCGVDSASVTIVPAFGIDVSISGETEFCEGGFTVLTASGADVFDWSTGEMGPSITVDTPGMYSVVGTSSCGQGTDSVQVTMLPAPVAIISGSPYICDGGSTELTASGGDTYQWSSGEEEAAITVTAVGNYTVTVTNACGSDEASIAVEEVDVVADFSADVTVGGAPLTVSFTNESQPDGAMPSWTFGDGGTSDVDDPVHVFLEEGLYEVQLTVTFAGCTDVATLGIEVADVLSSVTVPNVFSPNGDGVNDVFAVASTGLSSMDLRIFNRWGQLVAHLERAAQVWDARTFTGEAAAEGTYFYVLQATGRDGMSYDLNGTVTLVR